MQDTLSERSVHRRTGHDAAIGTDTTEHASAIERGIAQTLMEIDDDDSGRFALGAVPLDGEDGTPEPQKERAQAARPPRRRTRRQDDSGSRLLLLAMLISALLAVGMVGFAVTEGYIP